MTIITEIIPKDMPDWFKQDMEDGQVFTRMVKRYEDIEEMKYQNTVFRELLTSRCLLRKKEGIEQIWVECNWEVLQGE